MKRSFLGFQRFFHKFNAKPKHVPLVLATGLTLWYCTTERNNLLRQDPGPKRELYAWGAGQFGQLGLGAEQSKPLPEKVEAVEGLHILQLGARGPVSAVLTSEGKILSWGKAKNGNLGHAGDTSANVSLPTLIDLLAEHKITAIVVGESHMAAIGDDGQAITWGNNLHGKLGHEKDIPLIDVNSPFSRTISAINKPGPVGGELASKKCRQIACGGQHTIALTSQGEVYTWGRNRRGVLGYEESAQDVTKPKKVPFFDGKNIVKVVAGYDFNLALSAEGKVYSWGSNDFGQLGYPIANSQVKPTEVTSLSVQRIVDVSCGDTYSAALTEKGQLFTWGYGADGQLGHGNKSDIKTPKLMDFDRKISKVTCGNGHTAVITTDNELYLFGRGREGQLGRADMLESPTSYRTTPVLVESLKKRRVVEVACGGDHTLALVE